MRDGRIEGLETLSAKMGPEAPGHWGHWGLGFRSEEFSGFKGTGLRV